LTATGGAFSFSHEEETSTARVFRDAFTSSGSGLAAAIQTPETVSRISFPSFSLLDGCTAIQRQFLFYPSHHDRHNDLHSWRERRNLLGYSREVANPKNVWLMLHGNAGQATDRAYALPCFANDDSVYILEYPGYGAREGNPSKASFDAAAASAYRLLKRNFPKTPVCVVGESLGTGPACVLGSQASPPAKLVLIVPFDKLARVAARHVGFVPVALFLEANWDNLRTLAAYKGPVEIFAAEQDFVVPMEHAQALADSAPAARFHRIPGGHNDWHIRGHVQIRNP
jgi:uncharacterized protein